MPYDIPAMRVFALAILVVLGVGCGSKKRAGSPDVDRYINTELAPYLARALAARAGYGDITADDFEKRPARTKYRIRDAALPLLTEALDGASKLKPPPAAKQLHDDFIGTVRSEREAIAEMAAAFDPPDAAKFRRGHANMMDAQEYVSRWERELDETLASHGLKLKPLPDVKIPEPSAEPPAGSAAPKEPGVCEPGTAKPAADGSVTCALADNVVIGGVTIPKGSTVVLDPEAKVTRAVLPNGDGLCFDDEAKPKPCP